MLPPGRDCRVHRCDNTDHWPRRRRRRSSPTGTTGRDGGWHCRRRAAGVRRRHRHGLDVAIVHLAMHDAIQAYDQRFEPYAGAITRWRIAVAAAAKAAHLVLVEPLARCRRRRIDGCVHDVYGEPRPAPSPADMDASETCGNAAANNVIASRAGDGSFPDPFPQFTGGTGPGQWFPNADHGRHGCAMGRRRSAVRARQPRALPSRAASLADELRVRVELHRGQACSDRPPARTARPTQGADCANVLGQLHGQYNRLLREIAAAHLGRRPTSPAWATARVCSR